MPKLDWSNARVCHEDLAEETSEGCALKPTSRLGQRLDEATVAGGRPLRTDPSDNWQWHDEGIHTTLAGGSLMVAASLASIMDDQVTLSVTCLDRLYVNGCVFRRRRTPVSAEAEH